MVKEDRGGLRPCARVRGSVGVHGVAGLWLRITCVFVCVYLCVCGSECAWAQRVVYSFKYNKKKEGLKSMI